jgi:SAM-dependent methyltransferase
MLGSKSLTGGFASMSTDSSANKPCPEYVLGHSEAETRRLKDQAVLLRPITERLLRDAGIGSGMRVLDLGCGAGDVSLLAAELVGPGGAVLGIDRDAQVVAVAEARVIEAGHSQVSFLVASDDALPDLGLFDAVIGRYVLMHQKDPGVMVQRAASLLRPGGIIAFHEIGHHIIGHSLPEVPLFNQAAYWIHEVFRQSGVQINVGGRLVELLLGAGLPMPTLFCEAVVGGSSGSPYTTGLRTPCAA